MVIKREMYVGLHNIYPAMDQCKFGILKEVKMTAACNFISLGEKNAKNDRCL